MKSAFVSLVFLWTTFPVLAQEQEDFSTAFSRVKSGAVYSEKMGVDGSLISERYMLTLVTCSDGSKMLRVMLPNGPEDEGTTFSIDGTPSTLKQTKDGWNAEVAVNGKRMRKELVLKPVKDPKSLYEQQFEIKLLVGDMLWNAMRGKTPEKALLLIGTGGTPISLPNDAKFAAFLKSCGIIEPQ